MTKRVCEVHMVGELSVEFVRGMVRLCTGDGIFVYVCCAVVSGVGVSEYDDGVFLFPGLFHSVF